MPVKNEVWNFLSIVYEVYLTLESPQIHTLAPSQTLLWKGEERLVFSNQRITVVKKCYDHGINTDVSQQNSLYCTHGLFSFYPPLAFMLT